MQNKNVCLCTHNETVKNTDSLTRMEWNCVVLKTSNQFLLPCFYWESRLANFQKSRKSAHQECYSSHNILRFGSKPVFPRKALTISTSSSGDTRQANEDRQASPSACAACVAYLKGLLPLARVRNQVGVKDKER